MTSPLTILQGDALERLRELPSESVQCCVTSPPYWGLRDYGVSGQLGLEKTPQEFVAKLVEVFAEVRRVMKADGTCWVNLGDSYATSAGAVGRCPGGGEQGERFLRQGHINTQPNRMPIPGLKPKDLCGMPWRVAFALQADGWYLRSDIIWHKPNPMPESVTDRPTKAHEYLFLFTKNERYFYDSAAIMEPSTGGAHARGGGVNPKAKTPGGWDTSSGTGGHGSFHREGRDKGKTPGRNSRIHRTHDPEHAERPPKQKQNESFSAAVRGLVATRNKRTVWTIPTFSFAEAHFATYPPALVRPCVLAGSRIGDEVLDPFGGSGTTGMVALELGRRAVLIELNPAYVALIRQRCDVTPGLAL